MSTVDWINVVFQLVMILAVLGLPVRWFILKWHEPRAKRQFMAQVEARVNERVQRAVRLEQLAHETGVMIEEFLAQLNAGNQEEAEELARCINKLQQEREKAEA